MDRLSESVCYVKSELKSRSKRFRLPTTAIILGSGLGDFAKTFVDPVEIESSKIPHYPVPDVEGHAGKLIFGGVRSDPRQPPRQVLAFLGRSHLYETGKVARATYPVRLAHKLGIKNLILSNAAGGVNTLFSAGDLMLISSHINLTFRDALRDGNSWRQTRSDVSMMRGGISPYDSTLFELARKAAMNEGILLREGVYCAVIGPSYETAAEILMIRKIGADAVGMSTVLEAVVASQLGMKVVGISLITNLATGLSSLPTSHDEVIEVGRQARRKFELLITGILGLISRRN